MTRIVGSAAEGIDPVAAALPLIRLALAEDLGAAGDVTSRATIPAGATARAHIVSRQAGVLAGIDVAARVFHEVDQRVQFEARAKDGDRVAADTVVAGISGAAESLLAAERTALNFLQRLSGIATLTASYVEKLSGTGVTVLDTRKTTPGFRLLEKYAVVAGGGRNHRRGLHDAILIKDNHVIAAGGTSAAVRRALENRPPGVPIEVEVADPGDLDAALVPGVDGILLDNLMPVDVREAVARVEWAARESGMPRPWIEVSGGVSLETIRDFAIPGVDFISIGRLTHSAPALDLALDLEFT